LRRKWGGAVCLVAVGPNAGAGPERGAGGHAPLPTRTPSAPGGRPWLSRRAVGVPRRRPFTRSFTKRSGERGYPPPRTCGPRLGIGAMGTAENPFRAKFAELSFYEVESIGAKRGRAAQEPRSHPSGRGFGSRPCAPRRRTGGPSTVPADRRPPAPPPAGRRGASGVHIGVRSSSLFGSIRLKQRPARKLKYFAEDGQEYDF
jgi:hypothetical protein